MMSLVPNPHSFVPPTLERTILQIVPDPWIRRIVLERGDVDFAMQVATKDIPPERHAKLQRFQEIINGEVGTIPLFSEFDNAVMRASIQGYVSYPDGIPMLSKLRVE
jgi:ABC-type transport system substrate-binding protein